MSREQLMRGPTVAAGALALAIVGHAAASPIFHGLGALPDGAIYSRAHDVSSDGSTVVGESGQPNHGYGAPTWRRAFRWTEKEGMQLLGPGRAWATNRDGSIVVGANDESPWGTIAFLWKNGVASLIVPPPNPPDDQAPFFTFATGVSDDGSVIVGSGRRWSAWVETLPIAWTGRPTLNRDPNAVGYGGIGGGLIAGGYKNATGYGPAIFRGSSPQPLGNLGPSAEHGYTYGMAYDVSANGRVAVGYSTSLRSSDDWGEAFRWSRKEGLVGLGDLPGWEFGSKAWATSANGAVVVGNSQTRYASTYRGTAEAFYWTPTAGMQKLSTLLSEGFGLDLSNWVRLDDATGVSDSGLAIAGWGTRTNGVEEAFRVHLQQQIYINWDEAIDRYFRVQKVPRTLRQMLVNSPGVWPQTNWPATVGTMTLEEYQDEVVQRVGAIFAAAGAPIDILDSRHDAKPTAALEVRFGPPVRAADGTAAAEGYAVDVAPKGLPGVDRFNMRWDGQVAVFFDRAAPASAAQIAMQIAHEAGHGLGLRHVRPDAQGPNEVMDYYYHPVTGALEQFNDVVTPITEPPDKTGDVLSETHNPVYHLKRYVMGEDVGASKAGDWDTGSITIRKFEITNFNLPGSIFNLAPGMTPGAGAWAGEGDAWTNVAFIPELDPAGGAASFYSYAEWPVTIYASSTPSDTWDLVFGTGDASAPDLTLDGLGAGPLSGVIFKYDAISDAYEAIGTFAGAVTDVMTLEGRESVPEPECGLLLGVALLCLVVARKRP